MKAPYTNTLLLIAGSAITAAVFLFILPPKTQTPLEQTQSKNRLIEKAQNEINKAVNLKPIEFSCNERFGCNIPRTSLGWSGLDASNSTCIWTTICGSGAIPDHIVTTNGSHSLSSEQVCAGVDSVLCQNFSGQIYYGEEDTKIVPTSQGLTQ